MIVKYGNENGSITDAPNVRRNLGPSNCIAQPAHLPVRVLIVFLSIECLSVSMIRSSSHISVFQCTHDQGHGMDSLSV